MWISASGGQSSRGITVLGLLLLIVALVALGFFVVRFLNTGRQAGGQPPITLAPGHAPDLRSVPNASAA